MNEKSIIDFLKGSVIGQDPSIVYDEEFNPTDEQLKGILEYALVFIDPTASLSDIHPKQIYPLILYAKKEIFLRLATKSAPLYKIVNPDIRLDKGDRFDHYIQLVRLVDNDIYNFNSCGGSFEIEAKEVLLSDRYFSRRNYDLSKAPYIKVSLDKAYIDKIEISWKTENIKRFEKVMIYILEGNAKMFDEYNKNAINEKAQLIDTLYDIHYDHYRINSLKPNTKYSVLVVLCEQNGLQGFSELGVSTLDNNTI